MYNFSLKERFAGKGLDERIRIEDGTFFEKIYGIKIDRNEAAIGLSYPVITISSIPRSCKMK